MKRIFALTAGLVLSVMSVFANGNWRMHTSFSDKVTRVVETPEYVYMASLALPQSNYLDNMYTLFRYDKVGDEMKGLSTDDGLAYNTIQEIQYNPEKKYLVVVYSNSDIDFLYDNGKIVNVPTYRLSQLSSPKKVNSITVDPTHDRVYLATDFGYVALNDKKGEIAESRNYEVPLKGVARVGDKIVAIESDRIIYAPEGHARMSINDYETLTTLPQPYGLYPLEESKCLVFSQGGEPSKIIMISGNGDSFDVAEVGKGNYYNIENNAIGVTVPTAPALLQYDGSGLVKSVTRPEEDWRISVGSYNLSEIWHGVERKGLSSGKNDNGTWKITREYMLPDAPGAFYSTSMEMHPEKGLLVSSYGHDVNFGDTYSHSSPVLFSGYSSGRWTQYSPVYTNPDQTLAMRAPLGLAVDPNDSDYVYLTSKNNGILRINVNDPYDILHLSASSDPGAGLEGYVEFMPVQTGAYRGTCHFSPPHFDYYGNLWTSYADYDNQSPEHIALYCWTAEDRKKSTSASNVIFPKKVEVRGYPTSNLEEVVPMKTSGHRNLLVYAYKRYDDKIIVIDTNGTPTDSSDDQVEAITTFVDQDGNSVDVHYIKTIFEDPLTGYVWIGHSGGVFYFNPADVLGGRKTVNRVKVSRNDGTNLADYLLNEVTVNKIISDGQDRKWFATSGGGIVCTSSDGREIIQECNTGNSELPADIVYYIGYNSKSNSLMISTEQGLAEYFISGQNSQGSGKDEVKIYPNPVRPDYLGYINIEGVPSGSLVKIADSAGNVVKELGISSGSSAQWDGTNSQFKRVNSGVYFVMVSPGNESSGSAIVGKVLVVN